MRVCIYIKYQSYGYSNIHRTAFARRLVIKTRSAYLNIFFFSSLLYKFFLFSRDRLTLLDSEFCPLELFWRSPTERFKVGGSGKKTTCNNFYSSFFIFVFKLLVYHVQRCGEALYRSFPLAAMATRPWKWHVASPRGILRDFSFSIKKNCTVRWNLGIQ